MSSDIAEITIPIQEEKEPSLSLKRKITTNDNNNTDINDNNSNIYRSTCCKSKTNVDIRLLGFLAQCSVSFAVLGFAMRQIINSQRGDDLTIYYTLIGSIVGNFVPSYSSNRKQA